MLEAILGMFTTEEKVQAMLAYPIIKIIFTSLFVLFFVTLCIHLILFYKLKHLRTYLKNTYRMDIEPLTTIKQQFDERQASEYVTVETYVQEHFSNWRVYHIPVISLIKFIQMTVSLFILLGVLGTFIGLTISLGSIQAGSDQLVENVAEVLSGIDVAFYTSIIGMGCSLIMTVLTKVLNTEYMLTDLMLTVESILEGNEQKGFGRMIDISEAMHQSIKDLHETNKQSLQEVVDAFTGFKDYTSGLEQSAKDLAIFNDGLSENLTAFQTLFQQMKAVTDEFSEGTDHLNENFSSLFTYFDKLDEHQRQMLAHLEETSKQMNDVSGSYVSFLRAFDDTAEHLRQFTATILDRQNETYTTFDQLQRDISDLVETMNRHNQTFKRIFGDDVSIQLEKIAAYLNDLSRFNMLEGIQKQQKEQTDLLTDRFRELKAFQQTIQQYMKDTESSQDDLNREMKQITNTLEQFNRVNEQQNDNIKDIISHMGQFDSMFDTFLQHINGIETLLEDFIDSNDHIKRELDATKQMMQQSFRRHKNAQLDSQNSGDPL